MAKSKMGLSVIGSWAFLIGVILAIIFGFITMNAVVATILVVIGLIVGILNVTEKESMPFLISGVVLIIASSLGQTESLKLIPFLPSILNALLLIFVPATIIVAIKNVFGIARD